MGNDFFILSNFLPIIFDRSIYDYYYCFFVFCRNALPVGKGFAGCIKNLTFNANGKQMLYDLGNPADGENYTPGCDDEFVQAVTATDLNMNFLIAILVCIAIILVVVVALTVYRRKRHVFG